MKRIRRFGALGVACLCMTSSQAVADRVHLASGAVIEGKASRQGDKVVVEIESGQLALPASSVEKIESGTSDVQRVDAIFERLAPGDVAGLVRLANFCRDHDMSGREQAMLLKVIDVAPDHAEARARLGYVRANSSWIKREDQLRAQGMVEYEGKWITPAQMLELERLHAQTDAAVHERDRARAEAKKAEAEAEQARARASTPQPSQPAANPPAAYSTYATYSSPAYVTYGSPYGYAPETPSTRCVRSRSGGCVGPPPFGPAASHPAFPIAGVRDPFDYFR